MTNLTFKSKTRPTGQARGVTLVELLIVISILTVVAAILIPKLRVVNKDRNVREAARVVASAFAKAVNRASSEGIAGLAIVPNLNFNGPTSAHDSSVPEENDAVNFAGTRIYQMRRMPPYIGDDEDAEADSNTDMATLNMGLQYEIPRPFEHDPNDNPERLVVQVFDQISFNGSSYRYLITRVELSTSGANLVFSVDNGSAPAPQLDGGVSFVIHRQPRRIESSALDLPAGYMVDLRYSGRALSGAVAADGADVSNYGTAFNQNINDGVEIYFNSSGGIERMLFMDRLTSNPRVPRLIPQSPIAPLYWYVSHFEPNALDNNNLYKAGRDPIMNPTNKWVTLDPVTGSVNVASNVVPVNADAGADVDGDTVGGTLSDYIVEAQTIARTRQSANQ